MEIEKDKGIGTYDLAKLARVYPATILKWVELKKIEPSYHTPGGQLRFCRNSYLPFLKSLGLLPLDSFLIVDDEFAVRRMIKRSIQSRFKKITIYEAEDGFEAGFKVAKLMPNLVILDLLLPCIDGLKVCKLIKKNDDLKWIKILGITGKFDKAKEEFLSVGADDFLAKPFSPKELLSKIESLLNSSKALYSTKR